MKKVVVFGIQDFAELAHYYISTDTDMEVVAFTVNRDYMPKEETFKNFPVIPFEDIENQFSPSEFLFFAPLSPMKMNKLREKIYNEAKSKGYKMYSYISSKANTFNAEIGENCFIFEDNTIQPFVKIGNNVILWSGNHIGHHSIIKDHVMFTSHVVLSGHCVVESYATIGVNATIRDGVTIGEGTFVAMGAVVTKNTEPWKLYLGNPAKNTEKNTKDL